MAEPGPDSQGRRGGEHRSAASGRPIAPRTSTARSRSSGPAASCGPRTDGGARRAAPGRGPGLGSPSTTASTRNGVAGAPSARAAAGPAGEDRGPTATGRRRPRRQPARTRASPAARPPATRGRRGRGSGWPVPRRRPRPRAGRPRAGTSVLGSSSARASAGIAEGERTAERAAAAPGRRGPGPGATRRPVLCCAGRRPARPARWRAFSDPRRARGRARSPRRSGAVRSRSRRRSTRWLEPARRRADQAGRVALRGRRHLADRGLPDRGSAGQGRCRSRPPSAVEPGPSVQGGGPDVRVQVSMARRDPVSRASGSARATCGSRRRDSDGRSPRACSAAGSRPPRRTRRARRHGDPNQARRVLEERREGAKRGPPAQPPGDADRLGPVVGGPGGHELGQVRP